MEDSKQHSSSVQSVDRTLILLDHLAAAGKSCSIKYLSECTGLHKATVHRLLQTLVKHNYVRQDPATEEYSLGYHILSLSSKLINTLDIHSIARPYLQALCNEVGQAVQLSVLQGTEAIFIDRVDNPTQTIRMYSQIGKSIPAYCSSSGKALLAWQSNAVLSDLLMKIDFVPHTKTTIRTRDELLDALIDIKTKGYATDWFEHEDGIFCVAAPIFDNSSQIIAAIAIAGTIFHLNPERIIHYTRLVNHNAALISREFGCTLYPAPYSLSSAQRDAQKLAALLQSFGFPSPTSL